jgi:hypothetical protein
MLVMNSWAFAQSRWLPGPTSGWNRGDGDDIHINNHGRQAEKIYRIAVYMDISYLKVDQITDRMINLKLGIN